VLESHKEWAAIAKRFPKRNWRDVEPIGLNAWSAAKYEHTGLAKIHKRSYDANVLVEIRDVRVPASSHHPSFTRLAKHRTHLIAYTHADLIDEETRDKVEDWTNTIWPESQSIFVDTRADSRNDKLHLFDKMYDGLLYHIEKKSQNFALTVGVPNVGKSSVLMALLRLGQQRGLLPKSSVKTRRSTKKSGIQRGQKPAVEDVPGKTREITEYMLREKPRAFFMDVPGITPPRFYFRERPEVWLAYGAANLLPLEKAALQNVEMQKQFCDYVLHCANRDGVFHYVDKLRLNGPTNDIDECLSKLANKFADKLDEEKLTLKRCENFLKLYNTGNLGPLILDDMSDLGWRPFEFKDDHFISKNQKKSGRSDRRDYSDMYDGVGGDWAGPDRGSSAKKGNKRQNHPIGEEDYQFDDDDEDLEYFERGRKNSASKGVKGIKNDNDNWFDDYNDIMAAQLGAGDRSNHKKDGGKHGGGRRSNQRI
jgi:ribosome biogenesis GTPase A